MNMPNKARLLKVIAAVEKTDENLFDMHGWAIKTACGTVGCAVGCYVLKNPGCGLTLAFRGHMEADLESDNDGGWDSVRSHFGLDDKIATELFDDESYVSPTRANVIRRLRAFVAKL